MLHINLNNNVLVVLTKHGKHLWEMHHNKYSPKDYKFKSKFERYTNSYGQTIFQLWELFDIFGEHSGLFKPLCFKDNEIIYLPNESHTH